MSAVDNFLKRKWLTYDIEIELIATFHSYFKPMSFFGTYSVGTAQVKLLLPTPTC